VQLGRAIERSLNNTPYFGATSHAVKAAALDGVLREWENKRLLHGSMAKLYVFVSKQNNDARVSAGQASKNHWRGGRQAKADEAGGGAAMVADME
jgi:hypothetical protein